MAKTYTYTWAMTTWANRATATYVPIDTAINGRFVDRNGQLSSTMGAWAGKNFLAPYKVEDTETGVYYKTYKSGDGVVPVIKITEA